MAGLEGNIQLRSDSQFKSEGIEGSAGFSLDEPVKVTLMRDLTKIAFKLKYVMLPKVQDDRAKELRDWDLWGPLLLCLVLALTLSIASSGVTAEDTTSLVFGLVFMVVAFGAVVVTVNALLLGGTVSFFQSVCVLGYCLCPIDIAALLVAFLPFLPTIVKLGFVAAGFSWATYSSIGFMGQLVPDSRKLLAIYPVFLFYLFLGWLVIIII
jgi:hypothetical protein